MLCCVVCADVVAASSSKLGARKNRAKCLLSCFFCFFNTPPPSAINPRALFYWLSCEYIDTLAPVNSIFPLIHFSTCWLAGVPPAAAAAAAAIVSPHPARAKNNTSLSFCLAAPRKPSRRIKGKKPTKILLQLPAFQPCCDASNLCQCKVFFCLICMCVCCSGGTMCAAVVSPQVCLF